MQLGLVGLGRMGFNMRERLRAAGHEVVGYDRDPKASDVAGTVPQRRRTLVIRDRLRGDTQPEFRADHSHSRCDRVGPPEVAMPGADAGL